MKLSDSFQTTIIVINSDLDGILSDIFNANGET